MRPCRLRVPLVVWCSIALVLAFAPVPVDAENQAPTASRFGVVHDHVAISPETRARIVEAGFGWVHYILYWNLVNPRQPADDLDESAYEWATLDAEIDALAAAGLNVFVRVTTPPTWTTGASYPNNAILFCFDESAPPLYTKDRPDCLQPDFRPGYRASPPPGYDRSDDFRRFVRTVVTRYQGKVQAWGFGTEFHAKYFWTAGLNEFIDEILRPGYEEVKQIDPSLIVVGPDSDHLPAFTDLFAEEDRRLRQGTLPKPLFDAIALHMLGHQQWGPDNAATRFDQEIWPLVQQYGRGRPVWLTEVGDRYFVDSAQAELAQRNWFVGMFDIIERRPWIDKVFVYRLRQDLPGDFGIVRGNDVTRLAFDAIRDYVTSLDTPRFYYLAEGATNPHLWQLDVLIANPNETEAPAKVSFLTGRGEVIVYPVILAPTSRLTIDVSAMFPSVPEDISTIVESTTGRPLVVERTMSWDRSAYAGHTGSAVEAPSTTWYFAEGSQGYFDTYLLLSNSDITPATVTVTYLRENAPPFEETIVVPPRSRRTVHAGGDNELSQVRAARRQALVDRSFAIVVESDRPIIAERAMYFGSAAFWKGGHEAAGVTAPATEWFLAEGATGAWFDTWVLIGNPNDEAADVTVHYLPEVGPNYSRTFEVPRFERETIPVEIEEFDGVPGFPLANVSLSTRVESTLPIVVERAMYWPGSFTTWSEAHNSVGVTGAATRWGLAEGREGGVRSYATYVLVANPDPTERADLRVTYLLEDGTTIEHPNPPGGTLGVDPGTRSTIIAGAVPGLAGKRFGVVVESTNLVGIVVERAMYWNHPIFGWWSAGTNATGVPLP